MPDVISFGEPLVLFAPEEPGPLRHADRFRKSVVGAELNFCIAVQRLGLSAGWFGRIGDDEFGAQVRACLQAEGVDTSRVIVDAEAPTAVMFKEDRGLGDPRVFYYRKGSAASRLGPADVDLDYIANARCLHVTGITAALSDTCRAAVQRAVAAARAAGVLVSVDPNIRRKLMPDHRLHDLLLPLVESADVLSLGLEEGHLLFGVDDPEAVLAAARARGARTVAVKMGTRGNLATDGNATVQVAAFPVSRVVDTVGAGDGFAAGLVTGLLRGLSLEEAVRLGAVVGACAVTVRGDYEAYPSWSEACSLLGWGPQRPAR